MGESPAYLLVITPHHGDPELGMAGTVARFTREGKKVVYVICTNGDKGTSLVKTPPLELAVVREKEQAEACRLLQVSEVVFLRYPDLGLATLPDFGKDIVRLVMKYRPEVVATCDPSLPYFNNPDHRVTGRAVLDAVWPYAMAQNVYPELHPNGECHRVNEVLLWQPMEANYHVDITDTFDTKLAAFCCHKTQAGDPILPHFKEHFRETAVKAAAGQGYELGERFHRLEVPAIL